MELSDNADFMNSSQDLEEITMGMSADYDYDIDEEDRAQLAKNRRANMAKAKPSRGRTAPRRVVKKNPGFQLPTGRREPIKDPWMYAYLITGEKKIGKTSFALEGCEEFVLQFDKPNLAYKIREECPKTWREVTRIIKALEVAAEEGEFPYQRIIVDGIGEAYAMCQLDVCSHFAVEHPSDVGFAKGWHKLRDEFTDFINRILRLQHVAQCGAMFIAHAEWKEVNVRGGGKIEKLVPNLAGRCEEIVNGKVDAWFVYDYMDKRRVLVTQGDMETGAGHRIDGHFLTPDSRKIVEIDMGSNPKEAMTNFLKAFHNQQDYTTIEELEESSKAKSPPRKTTRRRASGRSTRGK